MLVPDALLYPMVGLATAATVIASQAVISGAFSLTSQAMQLGYCPRIQVKFTSEREKGQIYIPNINWLLLLAVIVLVLGFKSSSNLASAYGIAVTLTMMIDTLLAFVGGADNATLNAGMAKAQESHDQYTLELARLLGATVSPTSTP